MRIEYVGLEKINGPLIYIKTQKQVKYNEQVSIKLKNGENRLGNVIAIDEDVTIIQVYEGTEDMDIQDTKVTLTSKEFEIPVSESMLGRIFDGKCRPIDGLGEIIGGERRVVTGNPINPTSRRYPRNYIETGISAIDGLMTLIRGQKLPIFSADGLNHNELAEQIIRQSNIQDDENFAVILGLIGAEYETAEYFKNHFQENGVLSKVTIFQNLSNDPTVERLLVPKVALTYAEYLAFKKDFQVLVILTDMTSYAEALREISSLKGEIPSRKGYPGYLYSDLASIYERARNDYRKKRFNNTNTNINNAK